MSVESRTITRAIEGDDLPTVERLCLQHREQLLTSGELQYLFKFASCLSRVGAMEVLLRAGAEVAAPLDEYTEQTALYAATSNGATEGVRWLLAHGAPVNQLVEGELRCLPLFVAIRMGHAKIVRLLVAAGAVTRTVWNGQSPAECSRAYGHVTIAEFLAGQDTEPTAAPDGEERS